MYMRGSVLICVGGKKMVSDARYCSTLVTAKGGQMSVNCNDQWSPRQHFKNHHQLIKAGWSYKYIILSEILQQNLI